VTGLAVGALAVCSVTAVIVVLLAGLARAAGLEPPPPPDPVDVELRELLAEADRDAILNAARCDCPDCTIRREARRGRTP
jgi:hypothetical protein